jgi:hypothetical protein
MRRGRAAVLVLGLGAAAAGGHRLVDSADAGARWPVFVTIVGTPSLHVGDTATLAAGAGGTSSRARVRRRLSNPPGAAGARCGAP